MFTNNKSAMMIKKFIMFLFYLTIKIKKKFQHDFIFNNALRLLILLWGGMSIPVQAKKKIIQIKVPIISLSFVKKKKTPL